MSVVYDVAAFSQRTASQKGGTCWYYSAKMLLKFHDLFDRSKKGPENPLEAMHALRKLLTPARTGDPREIYSASKGRLRHPLDEKLVALEQEQKRNARATPGDDPIAQFLKEQGNAALATQISLIKGKIEAETDPAKMQSVIRLLEIAIQKETTRYDFLSFALPHIKFRQIPIPTSAAMLEESLRAFGPIYASGTLSIKATATDSSGRSGSAERVVAVTDLSSRGRHAIVIAGVTDSGEMFYKDPNQADELKCIHFKRFIAKEAEMRLLAIECGTRGPDDARGPMAASCLHCAQRLITQKVVPPLAVR